MSLNMHPTETEDVHFRVIAPLPTRRNLYRPALDIVVPVHNQAHELARAVRRLRSLLPELLLRARRAGMRIHTA